MTLPARFFPTRSQVAVFLLLTSLMLLTLPRPLRFFGLLQQIVTTCMTTAFRQEIRISKASWLGLERLQVQAQVPCSQQVYFTQPIEYSFGCGGMNMIHRQTWRSASMV